MKNHLNKIRLANKNQITDVDSNEIARQIAIETIKDTEKFFQRIANFFKGIWKFLTTPGMILGIFKFQKLDHVYESFLRNEKLMKILALVVAIDVAVSTKICTQCY